jgi:hypothetical protein
LKVEVLEAGVIDGAIEKLLLPVDTEDMLPRGAWRIGLMIGIGDLQRSEAR